MKNKKNNKTSKPSETKVWLKPSVKKLGNAKDVVASVNIQAAGDVQFSVLLPS
jgi:hypothetical protein